MSEVALKRFKFFMFTLLGFSTMAGIWATYRIWYLVNHMKINLD